MQVLKINNNFFKEINFKNNNNLANDKLLSNLISTEKMIAKLNQNKTNIIDEYIKNNPKLEVISHVAKKSIGLDKYFISFSETKNNLRKNFIQPILCESEQNPVEVPSSLLVYGSKKQTNLCIKGIQEELGDSVNFVNTSSFSLNDINNLLKESKLNYMNDKKRSVFIFNNAENLLSIAARDAKILGINLSGNDNRILKKLNSNMNNISYFKALLDNISKLPKNSEDTTRYATTFIFTSQYPHIIHPDLSSRNGKMQIYTFGIPENNSLKEIILNSIAKNCKTYSNLFNPEQWQEIIKELNPNKNQGGFSENILAKLVKNFVKNNKNFTLKENLNLLNLLFNTQRDIPKNKCIEFFNIKKNLGFQENELDISNIDFLIKQKEFGLDTAKTDILLQNALIHFQNKLKFLQQLEVNGKLSLTLSQQKQQIVECIEKINNIIY